MSENISSPDLKLLCEQVIQAVRPVGAYIKTQRTHFENIVIEKKGVRDFVTEVDKNAERMLVKSLHEIFPEAGFITEEKTIAQTDREYNWIIDPLDGTMNYVHGIPLYAISIALRHEKEFMVGVVFEIAQNEMFYTWKGAASFCNGDIITVSNADSLQNALIVTGFPYIRTEERTTKLARTLQYFLDNGRDIRRLGTAATDLCYIACGRIDLYYEGFLNIWDIAAGILIAENAGAIVSDFTGERQFDKGEVLACNKNIVDAALEGVVFMP